MREAIARAYFRGRVMPAVASEFDTISLLVIIIRVISIFV